MIEGRFKLTKKSKKSKRYGNCALCKRKKVLKESHRMPRAVGAMIKKNSFTGRLRSVHDVGKPVQDLDKEYMLCADCENRFSRRETLFMQKVLQPFRFKRKINLEYENWLYYFITSVSWRTLYYDVSSEEGFIDNGFSKVQYDNLVKIEQRMRSFLLDEAKTVAGIDNHVIFLNESSEFDCYEIPYDLFCNAATGYVFGKGNTLYVYHILAGVLIISVLKKDTQDRYKNTFVKNGEGKIKGIQQARSKVIDEIMDYVIKQIEYAQTNLPDKVKKELVKKIESNPKGFLKSSSSISYRVQNNL